MTADSSLRSITTAFLDRDGTLNVKAAEGEYVERPDDVRLLPRAGAAVRRLNEAGLRVIVVTNQRGIALGRMSEADLAAVHRRLAVLLNEAGANIDAFYYCPHATDVCRCRKPEVGMFLRAQREYPDISFRHALTVGDSVTDVEAGSRLGMVTALLAAFGDDPVAEIRRRGLHVDLVAPSLDSAVTRLAHQLRRSE